jgi:hypothetical protein
MENVSYFLFSLHVVLGVLHVDSFIRLSITSCVILFSIYSAEEE